MLDCAFVNLRKTFFILPNLFTLASVFCGFFSIITLTQGGPASSAQLYQAATFICFGFFFDMADGRVARLTKTQSALGLQLDSLADLVTFGVAPAIMVYRYGLFRLVGRIPHIGPHIGAIIAFLFVATGALRLARFNVLEMGSVTDEKKKPGKYILGLPVPVAASVLVALIMLNHQLGGKGMIIGQAALAVLVVVLSYLMVSRVRFRSFKDLKASRRTLTLGAGLIAAVVTALVVKRWPTGLVFVILMAVYVALGLMEEVIFFRRRRLEAAAARAPEASTNTGGDGGARSDEEVLEELGAFDRTEDETPGAAPRLRPAGGPSI